ncbi:STAS domain-containing protein [Herbaspirillum sp.]|uniref:STAS domain-containing protein n=1 Tax=Herbaspirillum sp. TaxID=1890675 RepID=UPI000C09276E|nr:STAS domain-containing protein [Herbaspirillum sp.]MAF00836.1 anti-anti-sigma factor [Herbaspirillum sp.]
MSVRASLENAGRELVIQIVGRFDFSAHQEFRDAYETSQNVAEYVVDLSGATYLDSSALGMLLLLRDHAGGDSSTICIRNCNDDVRKILSISNFEQLFTIQ